MDTPATPRPDKPRQNATGHPARGIRGPASRRILVINPNTSANVTETIRSMAEEEAAGTTTIDAMTARFGASYISSRTSACIAGHAVLDATALALAGDAPPDAIVLGCFGDPGIEALREICPVPVVGFAEAGIQSAAEHPESFAIVTNGAAWCEMLMELVMRLGLRSRVAAIESIEFSRGGERAAGFAINEVVRKSDAGRVVLGGAGLIPFIPAISAGVEVPVLDPHRTAVRRAMSLAAESSGNVSARMAESATYSGVSEALVMLLTRRPASGSGAGSRRI